jgi:hypothetical protein
MSDLAAFITARLDEAAARAWAVHDVEKCDALLYEEDMAGAAARTPDCDCGYPARTLREVAAGRGILGQHQMYRDDTGLVCACCGWVPDESGGCETLCSVGAIWSDHPDYRKGWAPGWSA